MAATFRTIALSNGLPREIYTLAGHTSVASGRMVRRVFILLYMLRRPAYFAVTLKIALEIQPGRYRPLFTRIHATGSDVGEAWAKPHSIEDLSAASTLTGLVYIHLFRDRRASSLLSTHSNPMQGKLVRSTFSDLTGFQRTPARQRKPQAWGTRAT